MSIVEFDGRPFAFAQDYDVHGWNPHPFSYLPPQSRGIDQYIGEADMLDRGHGSALVRQHVERLFAAGAPAVGTDPHPSNARARRAYEKAGFAVHSEPVDTPWGRAILMECWPKRAALAGLGMLAERNVRSTRVRHLNFNFDIHKLNAQV